MSKPYSVEWHRTCLANLRDHLTREQKQLQEMQDRVRSLVSDVAYYEAQIEEAVRQGKESFDRERFMKKSRDRFRVHVVEDE